MSLRIYATNLVDQATITASSENANFPLTNLQDPRRTKVFRSTGDVVDIVMDLQETSEIDSVFIVDEPRNGFGISSFAIDFAPTSDFSTPAHTETITFSVKHGAGFKNFTQQDYRFIRIRLDSSLAYCELSKIFIGKAINLNRSQSFGWTYRSEDLSTFKTNRYGQRFVDQITRTRDFNLSFKLLDKDHLDQIFELYDLCGKGKPFFISTGCVNMINEVERFAGMVYFDNIPQITNTTFGRYSLSMALSEAM